MKQLKFQAITLIALGSALFFSCNSGGAKKTDAMTADTTAAKPAEKASSKTETVVIVKHKVANYAKWKPVFDANDSVQKSFGLTTYVVGRGMEDSNMVVLILKVEDTSKAKEFAASPDLKMKMQQAGVVGPPSFQYLNVVMDDSSHIPQTARLMVSHKVKDWNAWKTAFDSHKQARIDAGLIDRGLGYSPDDNHQVGIVFAITDMQKATAFLQSKDLKDKMAEAGVDGPPTTFMYNIVQMK